MSKSTSSWRPITPDRLRDLLERECAALSSTDHEAFAKIRIEPKKVRFERQSFAEDVFIVAQTDKRVLFFDDVEWGFEVGTLDQDAVLRNAGASQFTLAQALYQFAQS